MDANFDAILRHVGELYLKSKIDIELATTKWQERVRQLEAQLQTATEQITRLEQDNHRLSSK